jgi:hypothetical protein
LENVVLTGETIVVVIICVLLDGGAMFTAGKALVKEISLNKDKEG